MTAVQTVEEKKHVRDLEHQLKIELLKVLQSDSEMKYFIGMAGGFGATALLSLLTVEDTSTGATTAPFNPSWGIIFGPAGVVTEEMLEQWMGETGEGQIPWLGFCKMSAASFGAACMTILILKAIFGEKGIGELSKGITSLAGAI